MQEHTNTPPKGTAAQFGTSGDSKFVAQHRSNVKSDLIEITEDKLRIFDCNSGIMYENGIAAEE